jgi:hypothetical protein
VLQIIRDFVAPINTRYMGQAARSIEHRAIKTQIDRSIVVRGVKNRCIPAGVKWQRGNHRHHNALQSDFTRLQNVFRFRDDLALHVLHLRKHFVLMWQKVLTEVVTQNPIFWNMTPRSSFHGNRSKANKLCFLTEMCWFLAWLIFQPWRRRRNVAPKLIFYFYV